MKKLLMMSLAVFGLLAVVSLTAEAAGPGQANDWCGLKMCCDANGENCKPADPANSCLCPSRAGTSSVFGAKVATKEPIKGLLVTANEVEKALLLEVNLAYGHQEAAAVHRLLNQPLHLQKKLRSFDAKRVPAIKLYIGEIATPTVIVTDGQHMSDWCGLKMCCDADGDNCKPANPPTCLCGDKQAP